MRFRSDLKRTGAIAPTTIGLQLLIALLAVLLMYRVFSPQFLVWIIPLAALRPWRELLLMLTVCVLSMWIYPLTYGWLVLLSPPFMLTLIFRNLLLLGYFVWLISPRAQEATEPAPNAHVSADVGMETVQQLEKVSPRSA